MTNRALPTFPDRFNIADYFLFDRIAEGFGASPAIEFGPTSYNYADVAHRSRAFASLLIDADIRRGERVLIVLPDLPAFAWVLFGTLARGSVVAMANPDAAISQLEYLVEYTRATAIVTVPRIAEALAPYLRAARDGGGEGAGGERDGRGNTLSEVRRVWCVRDVATDDDPEGDCDVSKHGAESLHSALLSVRVRSTLPQTHRDEPAMWLFTSGSTGESKANVHAHRDFAFNTEVYAKETVGYKRGDRTVSVPRLFFGYATGTNLFFPFAVGGTACLFSERPTPETLSRALTRYKPTVVTNVPTMLGKLLEFDEAERHRGAPGLDLSSVRFSLSAGEALPEALLRRWLECFRSDVYDGIGSAEMFHIYASNRPGDVKPGSLGKAVRGYELHILEEAATGSGAPPCAPGDIGVLWVKGDSVSFGYWLDRDKSFRTFHGHYCRTGDLFRVDHDGYLYFAGRSDDLLKVGGQWVAPVEVEDCLMKHDCVSLAAVVGVEEEGLLKPKAFIVLRDGHTASTALASALQEFVKGRLAKHKYPRIVEFVDDVPKNDRGKVDRKALRALHESRGQSGEQASREKGTSS